ncbi:hypothetical protein HK102_006261 [Quaeritorhiza haematococci]|nr:hypothetical protein HK102_006261 [Quaeritorhiza haematococci]
MMVSSAERLLMEFDGLDLDGLVALSSSESNGKTSNNTLPPLVSDNTPNTKLSNRNEATPPSLLPSKNLSRFKELQSKLTESTLLVSALTAEKHQLLSQLDAALKSHVTEKQRLEQKLSESASAVESLRDQTQGLQEQLRRALEDVHVLKGEKQALECRIEKYRESFLGFRTKIADEVLALNCVIAERDAKIAELEQSWKNQAEISVKALMDSFGLDRDSETFTTPFKKRKRSASVDKTNALMASSDTASSMVVDSPIAPAATATSGQSTSVERTPLESHQEADLMDDPASPTKFPATLTSLRKANSSQSQQSQTQSQQPFDETPHKFPATLTSTRSQRRSASPDSTLSSSENAGLTLSQKNGSTAATPQLKRTKSGSKSSGGSGSGGPQGQRHGHHKKNSTPHISKSGMGFEFNQDGFQESQAR